MMEMDDDCQDHGEGKRRVLKQLIQSIYRRVHWGILGMMMMLGLVYGIVFLCINFVYSSHQQQYPPHTLYNIFLHSSSLSSLTLSNTLIQCSIITFLLLITLLISTVLIKQLNQLKQQYSESVNREQNYGLQLKLAKQLKKSQIKGFVEYLEEVIKLSVNDKIFALSIISSHHQQRQGQVKNQTSYLQSIINKLTIIQDVIMLNYHHDSNNIQNNDTHKKRSQQQQQQSQQQSNTILVLLSCPEMKNIIIDWWKKKHNRQKMLAQILSIEQAQSPLNYQWRKLAMNSSNNNDNDNSKKYHKYILVGTLLEVIYIGLLSTLIYFQSHPQQLFPQQITSSQYCIYISYGYLFLESIIITIYATTFQQNFVNNILIKSIQPCITYEQQFHIQSILTLAMQLINILIAPLTVKLIVLMSKSEWNSESAMPTIEIILWGEFQLGYLIICYATMKWILYQGISLIITAIKRHSKQNNKSPQSNQQIDINYYHYLLGQFAILFSISIFINPVISVLLCLGLLLKIKEFLSIMEDVYHEELCFIVICDCFEKGIKIWCGLVISLGGLVGNGLLMGYSYGKGYVCELYVLIVFPALALCMFIFLVVISQKEINLNNINKFIKCQILPSFSQQFKPLQYQQQLPSQQQQLTVATINNNTNKQKQIASLLIKRIYTNQQFLFTYNQQLRKATFMNAYNQHNNTRRIKNELSYEMIKRQQTNKVTQELNTMSKSLEETLKQRLMTKSTTNPFHIAQHAKQDEDEFDTPYEKKVHMTHNKPKSVRIPMLFLPDKHLMIDEKHALNRKSTKQQYQLNNKNNYNKKHLPPKHKQIGSLNNIRKSNNNNKHQKNNSNDSDIEYDLINSVRKSQGNNDNQQNNNEKVIRGQGYHQRKVRFTDLFDSDEQSIKNLVKKKIKLSIPKITY